MVFGARNVRDCISAHYLKFFIVKNCVSQCVRSIALPSPVQTRVNITSGEQALVCPVFVCWREEETAAEGKGTPGRACCQTRGQSVTVRVGWEMSRLAADLYAAEWSMAWVMNGVSLCVGLRRFLLSA